MKKNLLIIVVILLIAFAFSFCSKSSSGPTPDFKYLGTWIGQNSYSDSVEIHVANVSNKQKLTYIKLIAAAKLDSTRFVESSTSGLSEVTNDAFSYTSVEPTPWDTTTVTINGTFQSVTSLNGTFNINSTDGTSFSGTYTATKQ
ncbi:MAG: hypothetical protein RAP70_08875 [Candidatus Celaenobacter antarcticus]|nr:hypothetical protein [Candidatus Celaenobacter antarcticus]